MEYTKIDVSRMDDLWELQKRYKAEIGEEEPDARCRERLAEAMRQGCIGFYGAWAGDTLIGCCSITVGFSTFDYRPSGVLEDFFIRPEFRHRGIAGQLVRFAHRESGVSALTVGCADCDAAMYRALGFSIPLGSLLAWGE